MVDLVNLEAEEKFFEQVLKTHVGKLAVDQQGTHIIQKVITSFTEANRQFVFDEIKEDFLSVSKTSHGLCVIKKLVANTTFQVNRDSMVEFISQNAIELIQDPYGNYAVQEIMEKWKGQNFTSLYNKVKGKIAQLSIQKFSSNVVEKCLEMSDPEQRADIIRHIAKIDKLVSVMRNSFGNYVVQKALFKADDETKEILADSIYENIPIIQDKKIKVKWAQLLQSSIESYPSLLGKYDLEKYLIDVQIQRNTRSPNELEYMRNVNDFDEDDGFTWEKKRYSPQQKIPVFAEAPVMLHPNLMSQHSFTHSTNSASGPFYNFDPGCQSDSAYMGYSQFSGLNPFGEGFPE